MKKRILFAVAVLFCTAGLAQAGELGIDFDTTYVSKYMWRGFDRLDDVSAWQPSVNLDLYGTGLSFNIWASYAGSGGNIGAGNATGAASTNTSRVNLTEYDYTLAYGTTLFESESYVTQFSANYIYYDFIDEPTRTSDAQEIGVGVAWPDICPMGIVPSYYVGKIWQSRSNSSLVNNYGGWVHIFGLGYDMTVSGILPDVPEQVISLGLAAVYNDGYGGATHEWTHMVLSAKTSLDCGRGTLTPGVYFQKSMDDSVNTEDEFWTSVSYAISF